MGRRREGGNVRRMMMVMVALALVAASCGGSDDVGASFAAPVADESGSGPVGEGIQVHGDWTITVVNPDGSVASETEFSNALTADGSSVLAGLLSPSAFGVSAWMIKLQTSSVCPPGAFCTITPPSGASSGDGTNLQTNPNGSNFVITGSLVAPADGQIQSVSTWAFSGVIPFRITEASITPVDVLAGQEVFVTVTISFS